MDQIGLIEKRVRKEIRQQGWMKKGAHILLINDHSINAAVQRALLNAIREELPIIIEERTEPGQETFDCTLAPINKDEQNLQFLNALFSHSPSEKPETISIIASLSNEEIRIYAEAKGLTGKEIKSNNSLQEKLEALKKKYPSLSSALHKSAEEWESLKEK